jgi:trans-aconitate 2-methyltransferase
VRKLTSRTPGHSVTSPHRKTKIKTLWNAADYAANSGVQQSWARELIGELKLTGSEHILDVGCGDGKVTAELARTVPQGAVIGVDSSAQMIRFARKTFPRTKNTNLKFRVMDARRMKFDEPFDVIFSNAALHWVDDHPAFVRGAASVLRPGGRLAISCGGKGNAQDVFHALCPIMRLARWRKFFLGMAAPYFFFAPEQYKEWLNRFGFDAPRINLVPKDAWYEAPNGLATWLRTTWLPYIQRLPETEREEFIAAVVQRYLAMHPPDETGRVAVRMVRLEIDAIKSV